MNILKESYKERNFHKAKKYATYFHELFNVPVTLYEDNNKVYFIVPDPENHPNKVKHIDMIRVYSLH